MSYRNIVDMAYPTASHPTADIVGFYIGGDTPHVWTDEPPHREISTYAPDGKLPIWVRSNPTNASEGKAEARIVIAWLKAHNVPYGMTVVLDLEIAINASYVNAFNSEVEHAGYHVMKYGSLSTIARNPRTFATWGAWWIGHPPSSMPSGYDAIQYQNSQDWDMSVIIPRVPIWGLDKSPSSNKKGKEDMPNGLIMPGENTVASWPRGECHGLGLITHLALFPGSDAPILNIEIHSKAKGWSQKIDNYKVGDAKAPIHFDESDVDGVSFQSVNGDKCHAHTAWDAS